MRTFLACFAVVALFGTGQARYMVPPNIDYYTLMSLIKDLYPMHMSGSQQQHQFTRPNEYPVQLPLHPSDRLQPGGYQQQTNGQQQNQSPVQTPVNPDPQQQSPVNPDPQQQAPVNPDPQQQAPVNPDPQQQAPVNPDPQQQAAVNPDPQQQAPVYPDPQQQAPVNPDLQQQQPMQPTGQSQTSQQQTSGQQQQSTNNQQQQPQAQTLPASPPVQQNPVPNQTNGQPSMSGQNYGPFPFSRHQNAVSGSGIQSAMNADPMMAMYMRAAMMAARKRTYRDREILLPRGAFPGGFVMNGDGTDADVMGNDGKMYSIDSNRMCIPGSIPRCMRIL